MANKTTTQAVNAFMTGKTITVGNTSVVVEGQSLVLKLHGNIIARREDFATMGNAAKLCITNAGWQSNTTKERLNGLPGVRVNQKAFNWFLNGNEWDGSWIEVSR